jgi:toxin ParE1/3/4
MGRVAVLPAADHDIAEQAEYLGRQAGLETAFRFLDATEETFAFLADHPGVGERYAGRAFEGSGIRVGRVAGFGRHLAFYRPIEGGIEVLRVIHGARDIDRVLGLEGLPGED